MVNKVFLPCLLFIFMSCNGSAETPVPFADPMRPAAYRQIRKEQTQVVTPQVKTDSWTLSAVLRSSSRRVALINGRVMKLGDTIEGFRLVTIETDRVVLENSRRKVVLIRDGAGIKKNSATEGNRK